MQDSITLLLTFALAIVPFVNALTGVIKNSFTQLKSNFYPLIAIVTGLILGMIFNTLPGFGYTYTQAGIAGMISGMISCGVYKVSVSKGETQK